MRCYPLSRISNGDGREGETTPAAQPKPLRRRSRRLFCERIRMPSRATCLASLLAAIHYVSNCTLKLHLNQRAFSCRARTIAKATGSS